MGHYIVVLLIVLSIYVFGKVVDEKWSTSSHIGFTHVNCSPFVNVEIDRNKSPVPLLVEYFAQSHSSIDELIFYLFLVYIFPRFNANVILLILNYHGRDPNQFSLLLVAQINFNIRRSDAEVDVD